MRSWAKWTAKTAAFAAGLAAAGGGMAGVALAGTGSVSTVRASTGHIPAADRDDVFGYIQAAINRCGNAIGAAIAHCAEEISLPGGWTDAEKRRLGEAIGDMGFGSGKVMDMPVNACGNAVARGGAAFATCNGKTSVDIDPQSAHIAPFAQMPAIRQLSDTTRTFAGRQHAARMPASTLSALQTRQGGQPLSGGSVAALVVGALLTGATALKVAGRSRAGKAGREGASA